MSHSPAPWTFSRSETHTGTTIIKDEDNRHIAYAISWGASYQKSPVTSDDMIANARLMAAAPNLLATLKTVAEDCRMALSGEWDKSDEGFQDTLDLIETAIKKATNESTPQ